jgi:hypothetical protein
VNIIGTPSHVQQHLQITWKIYLFIQSPCLSKIKNVNPAGFPVFFVALLFFNMTDMAGPYGSVVYVLWVQQNNKNPTAAKRSSAVGFSNKWIKVYFVDFAGTWNILSQRYII